MSTMTPDGRAVAVATQSDQVPTSKPRRRPKAAPSFTPKELDYLKRRYGRSAEFQDWLAGLGLG